MGTFHVDKPDSTMKGIAAACHGYKGNKYKVSTDIPRNLNSFWDGGSKTSYAFYSLDRGDVLEVESNHPMFEANKPRELKELPKRFLLVAHSIFCGKDMGITIYANQADLAPMLPKEENDLTEDELIVLTFTQSFKSSYAGISNYRFHEAARVHKITAARWETAKAELIGKGLLNKAGAITANGRNAVQGKKVRTF